MNIKTIGTVILAGVMIAGCGKKEEQDELAISVNGEKLMKSAIAADVEAVLKAQGDKIPAERRDSMKQMIGNQIVQSFIVEKVLVAKAKAAGFTVTDADRKAREDEFLKSMSKQPGAPKSVEEYFKKFPFGEQRARAEFENGILIDKMVKAEQAKAPAKDYTAEAQKMIDNVISNNLKVATAEADALKKIKELKAQLDKTPADKVAEKFAELAKANSACPSSSKGGDLGEFGHGQMVPEFDKVAFELPVGKVSEPVKTQFGYHLVMVTKKNGDKVQASHILIKSQTKQDVPKKEEVVKLMKQKNERAFVQEFVMKQIKAAKIEASEEYKQFLPEKEEPKAPAAKPVEKSAQK